MECLRCRQRRPQPDPPHVPVARLVGLAGPIVHGMWTSPPRPARCSLRRRDARPDVRLRSWLIDFVAPVLPGEEVDDHRRPAPACATATPVVEVERHDPTASWRSSAQAVVAAPRTVYVFPGQGIQSQGMGMEAYARSAAARKVWDRADDHTRERLGLLDPRGRAGQPDRAVDADGERPTATPPACCS